MLPLLDDNDSIALRAKVDRHRDKCEPTEERGRAVDATEEDTAFDSAATPTGVRANPADPASRRDQATSNALPDRSYTILTHYRQ